MKITEDNYEQYIGVKCFGCGGMIKKGKRVYGKLESVLRRRRDMSVAHYNLICGQKEKTRIFVDKCWFI